MTNTKFRKRALLSSVAMLLVAMLALGSATFAWFTSNTKVEAEGLTMRTSAESGLLITTTTELAAASKTISTFTDWDDEAALSSAAHTLQPVSLCYVEANDTDPENVVPAIVTMYTVSGQAEDNGTPAADAVIEQDTSNFYDEMVYFKLDSGTTASAGVKLTKVDITLGSATIASGARVAILNANKNVLLGEYYTSQLSPAEYLTGTGEYNSHHGTKTISAEGSDLNVVLPITVTQSASEAVAICVRIYLDGCDSNVKTTLARDALASGESYTTDLITNVELGFAMVTA